MAMVPSCCHHPYTKPKRQVTTPVEGQSFRLRGFTFRKTDQSQEQTDQPEEKTTSLRKKLRGPYPRPREDPTKSNPDMFAARSCSHRLCYENHEGIYFVDLPGDPGIKWLGPNTRQLPFKTPQIPSNRDHKVPNKGTLRGLGLSHNPERLSRWDSACPRRALLRLTRSRRQLADQLLLDRFPASDDRGVPMDTYTCCILCI